MDRVFYAAGPGNIIEAHKYWRSGEDNPTEVSITFSSQVQEFCKRRHARAYLVSYRSPPAKLVDGDFTLEHRPKPHARGVRFHVEEIRYALSLLATARQFRANLAIIDSGTSHFFMNWIFGIFGIKVVTVLHNAIWPPGFFPQSTFRRILLFLDALYFRWGSSAVLAPSPECRRQVEGLAKNSKILEFRAQFIRERFADIGPPPPLSGTLGIMFLGRITRTKGVFDILDIAAELERKRPGRVSWDICGSGPNLKELMAERDRRDLRNVHILGWLASADQAPIYNRNHLTIVPTRSDSGEGLAMTAAEAVLSGRPFISNETVPAVELLAPAAICVRANEVNSYVKAIEDLLDHPEMYAQLCEACKPLQAQFYDRKKGLTETLEIAVGSDR